MADPTDMIGSLAALRDRGWSVAVHNDYRVAGERYTFWLFTHPNGRWVKGEGSTDAAALTECLRRVDRYSMDEPPPQPFAVIARGDEWLTLGFQDYAAVERFRRWMDKELSNAMRV